MGLAPVSKVISRYLGGRNFMLPVDGDRKVFYRYCMRMYGWGNIQTLITYKVAINYMEWYRLPVSM